MRFLAISMAIAAMVVSNSAQAAVVVGPLSPMTMCPSGSMSETKGRSVYCTFHDPNVVEAGIGRCPSAVYPAQAIQSTVGKHTWCVISKPSRASALSTPRPPAPNSSASKEQASTPAKAARVAEPGIDGSLPTASLCDAGAQIIFACNIGKKSVSVCSSQNGIQYRYGIDRNTLDITLDAKGAGAGQYPLAGGGVWYYRFNNGSTSYVVYTAESSSIDKAGLVVEQGGIRSATLSCKTAAMVNEKLAGQPTDQKGFDLP